MMRRSAATMLAMTIAAIAFGVSTTAIATVVHVSSTGFAVRHESAVNAPPAKVYEALTAQIGSWWSSDHTYSGDAKNLSIDARAGGCFCERLKDGGSVEHLRVVYVAPSQALRMSGALGPLQAYGVAGSLTWKLAPTAGGTKMELIYSVGGFMDGGFDKIAGPVDSVLGEQFQRLKLFVETGKPAPAP